MEADAEKEISKLDHVLESVDMLFARVTNIGLAQQKMRAHLELNTQAIDDYECYIRDEDGGAPPIRSEGTALLKRPFIREDLNVIQTSVPRS